MSFPILEQVVSRRIVLVDLRYPYGKKKIYMNGSLMSVAAQLALAGHQVDILDYNIDDPNGVRAKEVLSKAEFVGVSVVGSPYFPQTIRFCQEMAQTYRHAKVVLGGQVVRKLEPSEFRRIFGKRAIQIRTEEDATSVFGSLPSVYNAPLQPVWEHMGDERLRLYLQNEFALFLSQGCVFDCDFCSADKDRPEQHKQLSLFQQDLLFLFSKAREFGLPKLECYASALDFFQNPKTVAQYMQVTADASSQTGVALKIRALSCMNTFLKASRTIPDFSALVRDSGLWCIGFGIDGPNKEVWKQQNKLQNNAQDIVNCLNLCAEMQIRAEVLMIMGYPNNTPSQLLATVVDCFRYIRRWPNTILRPYLAKTLLPGNLGWDIQPEQIEILVANPEQFYNLDLCALGSPVTHPRLWQRWLANLSFLAVIVGSAPFGRCASSPLVPQGSGGPVGWIAKLINRYMPFDR